MPQFDDRFVRLLPGDPRADNSLRQVAQACFSRVLPTPVAKPQLLAWEPEVARLLTLPDQAPPEWIAALAGNQLIDGMKPYAACYGGHQFGNWAGQLGDGRAITLGEVIGVDGPLEVQLKGPGQTPYSRRGDGRAVLRSSLREFVCSEAMHHLGVPTTRALALIATGELVVRDMFYDGRPEEEPGAITTRVAPSFLRFGNFEIHASRDDVPTLKALADFAVTQFFPKLGAPGPDAYVAMFEEVVRSTATLVMHWQRVGFVHGVMNTDNMSLLGLTIDYGPYGWLEGFDPSWTPNTTDLPGRRYAFGRQVAVAQWNLMCLAEALIPLVGATEPFQNALDGYSTLVARLQHEMWNAKFGLRVTEADAHEDRQLLEGMLAVFASTELDMSLFFRTLATLNPSSLSSTDTALCAPFKDVAYAPNTLTGEVEAGLATWLRSVLKRAERDGRSVEERTSQMNAVNPLYVPRNWLAQEAIDAASTGDTSVLNRWMEALRKPYEQRAGFEHFALKRPEWARVKPGCSQLSCSS